MEYWSIGVMGYWKEDKTAWQGRQKEKHRNSGMKCWNDGGKEIPPGLPLRQAQDDSLYEREETDRNGGRMENGGDPCKPGDS